MNKLKKYLNKIIKNNKLQIKQKKKNFKYLNMTIHNLKILKNVKMKNLCMIYCKK